MKTPEYGETFDAFYAEEYRRILGVTKTVFSDFRDAQEVASDVLHALWKAFEQDSEIKDLRMFSNGITKYKIRDCIRKLQKERKLTRKIAEELPSQAQPDGRVTIEHNEIKKFAGRFLVEETSEMERIVYEKYGDGSTQADIGKCLGRSREWVSKTRGKTLRDMKEFLQKNGVLEKKKS